MGDYSGCIAVRTKSRRFWWELCEQLPEKPLCKICSDVYQVGCQTFSLSLKDTEAAIRKFISLLQPGEEAYFCARSCYSGYDKVSYLRCYGDIIYTFNAYGDTEDPDALMDHCAGIPFSTAKRQPKEVCPETILPLIFIPSSDFKWENSWDQHLLDLEHQRRLDHADEDFVIWQEKMRDLYQKLRARCTAPELMFDRSVHPWFEKDPENLCDKLKQMNMIIRKKKTFILDPEDALHILTDDVNELLNVENTDFSTLDYRLSIMEKLTDPNRREFSNKHFNTYSDVLEAFNLKFGNQSKANLKAAKEEYLKPFSDYPFDPCPPLDRFKGTAWLAFGVRSYLPRSIPNLTTLWGKGRYHILTLQDILFYLGAKDYEDILFEYDPDAEEDTEESTSLRSMYESGPHYLIFGSCSTAPEEALKQIEKQKNLYPKAKIISEQSFYDRVIESLSR